MERWRLDIYELKWQIEAAKEVAEKLTRGLYNKTLQNCNLQEIEKFRCKLAYCGLYKHTSLSQ